MLQYVDGETYNSFNEEYVPDGCYNTSNNIWKKKGKEKEDMLLLQICDASAGNNVTNNLVYLGWKKKIKPKDK